MSSQSALGTHASSVLGMRRCTLEAAGLLKPLNRFECAEPYAALRMLWKPCWHAEALEPCGLAEGHAGSVRTQAQASIDSPSSVCYL